MPKATPTSPAPTPRPTDEPATPTATATPTSTDTATPTAIAPLTASSKSASQARVFPHEHVTYTIVAVNDGLGNATSVTVEDTVPAELTLDPASISGPAWTLLGSTILWGPFDVMASQSITMGFRAQPLFLPLPGVTRRTVTNVAHIAADGIPPFDRQAAIEVPYPPELEFASPPNLNPQTVLVGQTGVVFHIDVMNVGSAYITLDTTSQFKFEDAVGQSHLTSLAAPTFLPTGGAPVTLDFAPMDIPADATITGPSAWVSLFLTGLDENGVIHSKILTTTAATDQIIIQAPPPPQLHDTTSSLAPASVEQGQKGSFTIGIYNDGGSNVTLDTPSTFTFSDGTTVYLSELSSPTLIPTGGSSIPLVFAPFNVGAITPGSWPTNLSLHGSDAYGRPYSITFTTDSTNQVTVNAAPVLMAYPTPMPPPPFYPGSVVNFSWVNMQNIGSASGSFFNSSDNIVMAFETGSGWKPFTNGQVFPLPSGSPPTPPPGWEIITDTLNPVITFTVATSYSPYTWDANWQASFGFDTMAPTTPGVYTFTVYSTLDNGVRRFVDIVSYTVQ
jgi:uncharacterized repeat protein (TIGR01451 family)